MKIEVIPGKLKHVFSVVDNLRPYEKEAFKNTQAKRMLAQAFSESELTFTGLIDNKIACVWGVRATTLINNGATIWLLTTKVVDEHPLVFVRHSQIELKKLEDKFSTLSGYVLTDFHTSVKWLRWLGFSVFPSENPGIYYFEKKAG